MKHFTPWYVNDEGRHELHISADLETMGKSLNAAIWEIGAVAFHPITGVIGGNQLQTFVNVDSCLDAGLSTDGSTIAWWMEQSEDARKRFSASQEPGCSSALTTALMAFNKWVFDQEPRDCDADIFVWGNGIRADNVWLANAYARTCVGEPWKFWGDSDMRTLVGLCRKKGRDPKREIPFQGTAHTSLDDAIHQARVIALGHQIVLGDLS